jgi:hypothetical protein
MVPNPRDTFDHRRPVTTFAHLEADRAAEAGEDDVTHLEEVLALHDLARDPAAGTAEAFRARCLRNGEMRCMHHHVFDLALVERALRRSGFRPTYLTDAWRVHLLAFARRG